MYDRVRGLLLGRTRSVMLVVGVLAAVSVLSAALLDEGEVVRLTITDENGRAYETSLWIVDLEGGSYVRAAQPDAQWLSRLRARPNIVLSRGGLEGEFLAVPDDAQREKHRVDQAMESKYGFADQVWAWVSDRSDAVVVRLVPAEGGGRKGGELVGNGRNSH